MTQIINCISDLATVNPTTNMAVQVLNFFPDHDGGGGTFIWDATANANLHNGGTIISPTHSQIDTPAVLGSWWQPEAGVGCWKRIKESPTQISIFGAKGDGIKDDTNAIQATIDFLADLNPLGGGTILFPDGLYKITEAINIKSKNIFLKGLSQRTGDVNADFYPDIPLSGGAIVIAENDYGGAMFRLDTRNLVSGFTMEDICLAKRGSTNYTQRLGNAIEWYIPNYNDTKFNSTFFFNRVGIINFYAAFFANRHSQAQQIEIGNVKITNSYIHHNNHIVNYFNNAAFNMFTFQNNAASQNGGFPLVDGKFVTERNVINIKGACISIKDNILEGGPNAITINNSIHGLKNKPGSEYNPFVYSSINIEGNYFESNYGSHLIFVEGAKGVNIGYNSFSPVIYDDGGHSLKDVVVLKNCINSVCKLPVREIACLNTNKSDQQKFDKNVSISVENGALYSSMAHEQLMNTSKSGNSFMYSNCSVPDVRENVPFLGNTAVRQEILGIDESFEERVFIIDPVPLGDWLVVSLPVKFSNSPNLEIEFVVNEIDSEFIHFDTPAEKEEWYVVTLARKMEKIATTALLKIKPYKNNENGIGGDIKYLSPTVWSAEHMGQIRPWFNTESAIFNSIPTKGEWNVGDKINIYPTIGKMGYVCTKAGDSLNWEWKGYGELIQP